ncbi:hypothetical protein Lser_V15G04186 [Lactuca serriola]
MGRAFRYVIIGGGVAAGYAGLEFTKKVPKASIPDHSVHPNPDVYNFVVDWPSASRGESKVKRSMQGCCSKLEPMYVKYCEVCCYFLFFNKRL